MPSVRTVPTEALRRPLLRCRLAGRRKVPIPSVMLRAAQDSAGTLNDRLITVVGFTVHDGDAVGVGQAGGHVLRRGRTFAVHLGGALAA